MARSSPKHYFRCIACHSLVPTRYRICADCGHDHSIVIVNDLDSLTREFNAALQAVRTVDDS